MIAALLSSKAGRFVLAAGGFALFVAGIFLWGARSENLRRRRSDLSAALRIAQDANAAAAADRADQRPAAERLKAKGRLRD